MPKRVDQQARRGQIAEALWRVAARGGLEAVSLRDVAAEAGVSMGLVQHYFKTKEQMLTFTLQLWRELGEQRVRERLAASGEPFSMRLLVREILAESLMVAPDQEVTARAWVAFAARAAVEPGLARILREGNAEMVAWVAGELRQAQARGEVAIGLDADREAGVLMALVDGLTVQVLLGQHSPSSALATLDYQLDRIYSPAGVQAD